ncbi:MAG: hypothetical protein C0167_03505 [Nitrososphaera sp.]|nr:MAG: hypothetical protein C0167_03505 [Nitrososphaera sp.]
MPSLSTYLEIRRITDILYDVQKVRLATENRLRTLPKKTYGVYPEALERMEEELTKRLEVLLQDVPVWTEYLSGIKGVGPRIAGSIIGRIQIKYVRVDEGALAGLSPEQQQYAVRRSDGIYVPVERGIAAFPNVSKFWKYFGVHVEDGHAPRRRRGESEGVNTFLKMTVLKKLADSLIRTGARVDSPYERLYRKMREEYRAKYAAALADYHLCPRWRECQARIGPGKHPPCNAHIDAMARRYMVKEFLKDLWINWRRIEGLETVPTYIEWKDPKGVKE